MSDNPHDSCIICGHDRPLKAWKVNQEGIAIAGVCEECLNYARGYLALKAQVAVMAQALEANRREFEIFNESGLWRGRPFTHAIQEINKALSPSAGKELLERVRRLEKVMEAASKLLEVAILREDHLLPHPANDPKLWSARMQSAWDDLAEALAALEGGNEDGIR